MTRLEHYNLLSGQSIHDFTPETYREYVKGLNEEDLAFQLSKKAQRSKKAPSVVDGIGYRVNSKGTKVLTCRRKDKIVTGAEVEMLARHHKVELTEMWNLFLSKKYKIEVK